jgi:hypothetical protein
MVTESLCRSRTAQAKANEARRFWDPLPAGFGDHLVGVEVGQAVEGATMVVYSTRVRIRAELVVVAPTATLTTVSSAALARGPRTILRKCALARGRGGLLPRSPL